MTEDYLEDDFGVPIDTRTPEERELDRLRDWLSMPNWCLGPGPNMLVGYSEAACLLAGIDPERTMGNFQEGFAWNFLPGALSQFGEDEFPRELLSLEANIFEDLGRLSGLKELGAKPVKVIISHALEAGFFIPWLAAARADPECAKHLPDSAFKGKPPQKVGPAGNAVSRSSSKKAKYRWKKDPKTIALNEIGKPMFEKWFNESEMPKGSQAGLARKIWEELCKRFPKEEDPRTLRTIASHIREWKRERESKVTTE